MTPIRPADSKIAAPSTFELACRYVPILGWIAASQLEQRRTLPARRRIDDRLRSRTKPDEAVWQGEQRRKLALFAAQCIREELDQPNSHFVPDDYFGCFFIGDDGASTAVLYALEEYLEMSRSSITEQAFESMLRMSFGEVVDRLLELQSGARNQASTTRS